MPSGRWQPLRLIWRSDLPLMTSVSTHSAGFCEYGNEPSGPVKGGESEQFETSYMKSRKGNWKHVSALYVVHLNRADVEVKLADTEYENYHIFRIIGKITYIVYFLSVRDKRTMPYSNGRQEWAHKQLCCVPLCLTKHHAMKTYWGVEV
jgi:hypothetical protein